MATSFVIGMALWAAAPYAACVLNTDASIWDVAAKDVTGDGKAELFALCCDEKSDPLVKFVDVFVMDASGQYPARASMRIALEPSVSALFFAETDGAPPAELVAANGDGATIFRYGDGKFTPTASPRFTSLLPSGSKEPIFLKDAAMGLNGDGIDEWLIPVSGGYEIRTPTASLCRVPCDVVSEIRGGEIPFISHHLPSCHAFEIKGQQPKCVAFLSDEFADFAYGANWSEHKRFKIPLNLEDKWEAVTGMEDINGDGLPDLVVTQLKGTVNMKAVTHVYLASGPFTYPEKPTATFETTGAIASPVLVDADNDGKKDLLVASIPFGVRNMINYFVRGKISVHVNVHLFKDGGFNAKPDFSENFLLDAPEGRERLAYTLGDFNGDGRMDVAFGAGANKLVIHTGSAEQMVSAKPWVTLDVPSFGEARPYDLNGNKAKDLVLFHPGGPNRKRLDVVLF